MKSSASPVLFPSLVYFWSFLILCTFALLWSEKMTWAEVLWALPDEMFPWLPAIAKTEFRPSWSHPSRVPNVPTYPPYKQKIRVIFRSPFEHACLNSASAASIFISDWGCPSGILLCINICVALLSLPSTTGCTREFLTHFQTVQPFELERKTSAA